jgi:hypothetical protein
MPDKSGHREKAEDVKSFIKSFGLCSHGVGGNPAVVDVKNGRVTSQLYG